MKVNQCEFLPPMRPGVNLGNNLPGGWSMQGWLWQPKINDERAMLRTLDGTIFNRHGELMDSTKVPFFWPIISELRSAYRHTPWVDLGLIGFRDSETFRASRGAVIVFDIPGDLNDRRPWLERREQLNCLPSLDLMNERPKPGMAYRFEETDQGGTLFQLTRGVPGLEGVIGRNVKAPYQPGDSRQMAKARWLKG